MAAQCFTLRGIRVTGKIIEIHGNRDPESFDQEIRSARDRDDSVGGIIRLTITGCPSGLGDPVFGKLDALLAASLMSIGGVKGIEIGSGFAATRMCDFEHN